MSKAQRRDTTTHPSGSSRSIVEGLEDELDVQIDRLMDEDLTKPARDCLQSYAKGLTYAIASMRWPYEERDEAMDFVRNDAMERREERAGEVEA